VLTLGRSDTVYFYAEGIGPPTELESGSYRYVFVSEPFVIDPAKMSDFKAQAKAEFEASDPGHVFVDDIKISYHAGKETFKEDVFWFNEDLGRPGVIDAPHTNMVIDFRVQSPVPILLVVFAIGVIIGIAVTLLLSGVLLPLLEFLIKNPAVTFGLVFIAILLLMGYKARD